MHKNENMVTDGGIRAKIVKSPAKTVQVYSQRGRDNTYDGCGGGIILRNWQQFQGQLQIIKMQILTCSIVCGRENLVNDGHTISQEPHVRKQDSHG